MMNDNAIRILARQRLRDLHDEAADARRIRLARACAIQHEVAEAARPVPVGRWWLLGWG